MVIRLRPYQREAVDATWDFFREGGANPLVVIPTAGGKSLIIGTMIQEAVTSWLDTRVLVLAHVPELLTQNMEELLGLWPEAPVGLCCASLGRKDIRSQILFAAIQSIHKRAYDLQRVDLIFIDEAHLLSPNDRTMYRRLIGDLLQINPYLRVIGFSATPYRLDSGYLHEGEGALFTGISYEAHVGDLITQGHLSPLISTATATRFDVSSVGKRGGDYISSQLAEAVDQYFITSAAVEELMRFGSNRRSWLVFCSGVQHAIHVRDEIRGHGISSEMICGETPMGERKAILKAFRDGEIRSLTNANCLTTGTNVRPIDLIALMRPTKSTSLYVQMVGRGMRLSPETKKTNCLVLDFAKVVAEHGPIDEVKVKKKCEGEGTAPTKSCPICNATEIHASLRHCPYCDHEFPPPQLKIEAAPARLPIMSTEYVPPQWVNVDDVSYKQHNKPGKPPSLCVTYRCGLTFHREWICFEHEGLARAKAITWWQQRASSVAVPDTIVEALANTIALRKAARISVRASGKYTEIVGVGF